MEQFGRLLEEQQKAIEQTDKKITRLQAYVDDYAQLKTRLEGVSKCFSKKVIIPFSPRALVPARLIHTNEVLVYLGGSAEHFCEVSTFQSISIIDKRIWRMHREIQQLQEQKRLLTDRASYTQRLVKGEQPQNVFGDGSGSTEIEIREEFDPEREKEWQEKHKERVQVERMLERADILAIDSSPKATQYESPSYDTSPFSPDITFRSSSNQALPVDGEIKDWHKASPADVVSFFQKSYNGSGLIKTVKSTQPQSLAKHYFRGESRTEVKLATQSSKYPIEPFSQIVEREPASIEAVDRAGLCTDLVSRFRARRNRNM